MTRNVFQTCFLRYDTRIYFFLLKKNLQKKNFVHPIYITFVALVVYIYKFQLKIVQKCVYSAWISSQYMVKIHVFESFSLFHRHIAASINCTVFSVYQAYFMFLGRFLWDKMLFLSFSKIKGSSVRRNIEVEAISIAFQ